MLAERTPIGYRFIGAVPGCSLRVELTLHEDGTESVALCSDFPRMRLPPESLPSGTLARLLGEHQWADFERLRKKGFSRMRLDPEDGDDFPAAG